MKRRIVVLIQVMENMIKCHLYQYCVATQRGCTKSVGYKPPCYQWVVIPALRQHKPDTLNFKRSRYHNT